jgi:hypothetical protein
MSTSAQPGIPKTTRRVAITIGMLAVDHNVATLNLSSELDQASSQNGRISSLVSISLSKLYPSITAKCRCYGAPGG